MAKMKLFVLFVFLGLIYFASSLTAEQIAITGGTLIDVRTQQEIKESVILIQGDRIAEVGKAGKTAIPPNAHVIDASGKWIVPGYMDMHVHVAGEEDLPFEMYLAKGVTTIRDCGGNLTLSRLLREDLDSGQKIGPRYFFAGPILDGIPPVGPEGSFLVDTPERAASAVNFLIDQGVDFIKIYNNVKEPEFIEILKTAHSRGVRVAGHVPRSLTVTHVVESGMDCLEHVRITGRELLTAEEADQLDFLPYAKREILLWKRFDLNSEKMRKLVSFLAQNQVFMDVTLVVDYQLVTDPEQELKNPDNRYLPEKLFEIWKSMPQPEIYKVPSELKPVSADAFQNRQKFVGLCYQAGARIITGTDGPGLGMLLPGFALHHEFQMLSEAGMTPGDILRATTIRSAEALGKEQDLGTIEKGKYADLLILQKNPLLDVSNLDSIEKIFKGGQILDPQALLKQH
jgi:imidazolonepropionase-like amidohydrolase